MRVLTFVLASLISASALAASPASSLAPTAIKPESKFSKSPAIPKWSQTLADVPTTSRDDPVVVRLSETQAWIGTTPAVLYNQAIQVNERSSLGTIGQVGIDFYPRYQSFTLHRLVLLRGEQKLDRTASVDQRFLQRETRIESGMYGGATTVQFLLDDVRVGDTLLLTYSIEGRNPVFGKWWSGDFSWDSAQAIESRRLVLFHPVARPLEWRQLGDFRTDILKPTITRQGDIERVQFDGRGIDPVELEPSTPSDFLALRMLQFHEHKDWKSVASWAGGLFPATAPTPAVKKLAQQFATGSSPLAQASAALYWVQNEIRYFSVSIGQNSHRPQSPDAVIARRYGDCKDKSYLLVALLAQLGIQANAVLLSSESPRLPAKLGPSPSWFDHVIVQIRIGDMVYFVDPTRTGQIADIGKLPTIFSGASVLVVSPETKGLTTMPERVDTVPSFEQFEQLVLSNFDGDAVLNVRIVYRDRYADAARANYPAMSSAELKRDMLERYEKTYPGVSLADKPLLHNDSATGNYEVSARLLLPKPIKLEDKRYSVRYDNQILDGALGIPSKLVRQFPFMPARGKYWARYNLSITWPESVRANSTPTTKRIDNAVFSLRDEYVHLGRQLDYMLDFQVKSDQVAPGGMAALQEQSNLLKDFYGAHFYVGTDGLAKPASLKLSLRDLDGLQQLVNFSKDAAARAKELKNRKMTDADVDLLCKLIHGAFEFNRFTGGVFQNDKAEMEKELQDNKTRPGVMPCLMRLRIADSDYDGALAISKASPAIAADNTLLRDLAWARYYVGDVDGALADMQRYIDASTRKRDGAISAIDLASHIALLQRSGKVIPEEVVRYANVYAEAPWPHPVLAMQVGAIDSSALLERVNSYTKDTRALMLSDIWFYIGQQRMANGDKAGAASAWRKVIIDGLYSAPLYAQAGVELQRLESSDDNYRAATAAFVAKDMATGMAKLQASADAGLAAAQNQLGRRYLHGAHLKQDYAKALHWFNLAAQQGYADAQNNLGMMYASGQGVPADDGIAVKWYRKAADQDYPYSLNNLAERFESGTYPNIQRNYKQAYDYYLRAANQGHADAQSSLANLYDQGWGVDKDEMMVAYWSQRAAWQGNALGQAFLGRAMAYGKSRAKDVDEAAKLLLAAAQQGNHMAQEELAILYSSGQGVAQKGGAAIDWFEKAAAGGRVYSQLHISRYYRIANSIGVRFNPEISRKWLEKAAAQDSSIAHFELSEIYRVGEGVDVDIARSFTYLRRAAELGNADAQLKYALALDHGRGLPVNASEAAKWYRLAADQGKVLAMTNLADLHENGTGIAKDLTEAVKLYRQAATKGSSIAFVSLALLIEQGKGVPVNKPLAYTYFEIAARAGEKFGLEQRNALARTLSAAELANAIANAEKWTSAMPLPQ
jgi:TPR repeat protein